METAACMSKFFLLMVIAGAPLNPDPHHEIKPEGGSAELMYSPRVDYWVLYKVSADGDLLKANCSQPEGPQPGGHDVHCPLTYYITMHNLNTSQSGAYRSEGWRAGNITERRSFHLTVCAEVTEHEADVAYDGSAELCRHHSTLGQGDTSLQLYRENKERSEKTLVLDTNSSLEPLVGSLRGRLQVNLTDSLVTLSGITEADSFFYCVMWTGAQCQSYTYTILHIRSEMTFAYEEDNVTLSCISKGELPSEVHWLIPPDYLHLSNDELQEEGMHMLNDSQTGDYSLSIHSVRQYHSGKYDCVGHDLVKSIDLYVCTQISPLEVIFSHGESLRLVTARGNWDCVQWYRQKVLPKRVLILDSKNTSVFVPEDLRGRVTMLKLRTNHSLIISNLTAEDSGVYTWRVFGGENKNPFITMCSEGTIHLLYKDPFGVDSPFYRAYGPLIACVLLGLVSAVIWVRLRSRRGGQTSGQQSGDEDSLSAAASEHNF